MSIQRSFLCAMLLIAFLTFLHPAAGQVPSLAASDQYVVTVPTEAGDETFTIIRDGRLEEQFYYIPVRPIVAWQTSGSKRLPVFSLLKYQRKNEDDKLVQGAILQMSMVMGVTGQTVDKLLAKIKDAVKLTDPSKKIKLSPLQLKSALVTVYDLGGDMIGQAPPREGVGPIFGTQQYPFMLKLKTLGADAMEALCRKRGGLPVLITYTFQGMTPKGGFKVEVNWDSCYKHFSTNAQLNAEVGNIVCSRGIGADISKIRDEMLSNGMIKITSLANESITPEQIDDMMGSILPLITKELFEQLKPPAAITPASVKEVTEEKASPVVSALKGIGETAYLLLGAAKFNFKSSYAMKDAKYVKKGTVTYTFDRQAIVDRTAAYGGLLGIGEYSKDIQDACITTLAPGNWESAYFMVPPIGDPDALGIDTVDISVVPEQQISHDKWAQVKGLTVEYAVFNKGGNKMWSDKSGREVTRFLFPLKALYETKNFRNEDYRFKVTVTIKPQTGKSISLTRYTPIFDGDLQIAPPSDLVDVVTVDGSCLTFGAEQDQVYKVLGQLKAGALTWGINLSEERPTQTVLVPANEKNITIPSLKFVNKKGVLGNWTDSGKNLRDVDPGLWFMLFDNAWKQDAKTEEMMKDTLMPSPF
ncbi:hypothetical protein KBA41_10125 [Candidatus Ozemobacteraceae bacterium]|nr:hypothetical protein [Candidatus Ozemobacteraceae bacterium]